MNITLLICTPDIKIKMRLLILTEIYSRANYSENRLNS